MTKTGNEDDKGTLTEPAMRGTHRNVDHMMLFSYCKWAVNLDSRVLGVTEKRKTNQVKGAHLPVNQEKIHLSDAETRGR